MSTAAGFAGTAASPAAADAPIGSHEQAATHGSPARGRLAHALGLIAALLVAGGFALGLYMPNLHNGLIAATFTAVGVFVVHRRPGNREAWLFIASGVAHAVMFFGRQYGLYAGEHAGDALPAVSWVTWTGVWLLPLVLVLIGVTIMCFPDGRLPSPRWRPVVVAMAAAGALLALLSALWPVEYADNSLSVPHPLQVGGYEQAQAVWDVAGRAGYLLIQIAWAACVVLRLRRARGDEARQLRWFVYAVGVGAVAMTLSLVALGSAALGVLAVPVVPLAAGAAIVKYRLYDIDVVINKTLVVGAMAAIITAGYIAVVSAWGVSSERRRARTSCCRWWRPPSSPSPSSPRADACSTGPTASSTATARRPTRPWPACRRSSAPQDGAPTCSPGWRRRSPTAWAPPT